MNKNEKTYQSSSKTNKAIEITTFIPFTRKLPNMRRETREAEKTKMAISVVASLMGPFTNSCVFVTFF